MSVPITHDTPQGAKNSRVLVLYNRPPGEDQGPFHVVETEHLEGLAVALDRAGYQSTIFNVEDDVDRIHDAVVVHRPAVIFNLIDHMWGDNSQPAAVAGMLDLFGYVYAGSAPNTLTTCQDRARTHVLVEQAGLPVSPYVIVRDINSIPDTSAMSLPQIVTQAFDDIYDDEQHRDTQPTSEAVHAQCEILARDFDYPLLIESALPGQRIVACVIGNRQLEVLPLSEIRVEDSERTVITARLKLDQPGRIRELACRAFRAMDLRDFGQVDFVVGPGGDIRIIDVRPAVDLFGPVFQHAAGQSTRCFEGVIAELARLCHERLPAAELASHPLPTVLPLSGAQQDSRGLV